ncbi:diguanylate cyclase [Selenomonas timonae]|uniref:Diguanylate cyclase n=1 Tax=Selenomonas timonae TaxID=2754044 RepID=A0A7G7VKA9_9FIRM|nr:GGDEF domain-containing protein [Selenomonas timonae]QNH54552.1 diguanylate cyclase [Selenomonas timonae]
MNRRWCKFVQMLFFALLVCTGHIASAETSELSWEYWQTDSPEFSIRGAKTVPAFPKDEGRWRKFNPQFGVAVPEGTHHVWIRVYIPPDTGVDESLFFSTTDQSVQIFLDGVSIYRYGDLGQHAFSYGRKWHLVDLPAWAVGRQLYFQVHSDNIWVLGQFDRIRLDRPAHQIEDVFLYDFPYVSGITALLIFIMLLGVYFFTEKELRDIYLRLIVVLFIFFVWMLSASSLVLLWLDWPVFWRIVELVSSYLIPLSANLLIYSIIDEQYKKNILCLSSIYGIIFVLAVLLEILGQNGLYLMRFCFYPALALCGLVTGYWLWLCYKRGNQRCRSLLVAFGTLSVLAVVDGLSSQYRIFGWHTYFVPFGIYTIGFFIVQLILERAAHERYLAELSASLENEVSVVTKRMEVDPLTGAFNRNKFPAATRDFMRISLEIKEPFALIMFDIDHFKSINDTYGHDVGDVVLVGFAQTISAFLDRRHVLIRWGGEEFILLCLHYDGAQAEAFANVIREAVSEAHIHPSDQVTCSGGVAIWYGTAEDTVDHMVKRADTALYQSKENGRNRITCEPDWREHMPPRRAKKPESKKPCSTGRS